MHITRAAPGFTAFVGRQTICGAGPTFSTYRVTTYYAAFSAKYEWCPECVAALTPLDELGNTEL